MYTLQNAVKIMAKDLLRTNRYVEKFMVMRANVQAVSPKIQVGWALSKGSLYQFEYLTHYTLNSVCFLFFITLLNENTETKIKLQWMDRWARDEPEKILKRQVFQTNVRVSIKMTLREVKEEKEFHGVHLLKRVLFHASRHGEIRKRFVKSFSCF